MFISVGLTAFTFDVADTETYNIRNNNCYVAILTEDLVNIV